MRLGFRTFILIGLAAVLAGCAGGGGGFNLGGTPSKPKVILVSDFVLSGEVTAVDRGFTARLERKVGQFPTHERKQRTVERVNDEIVASIIAALREAGFEAQPGNEESLSLSDDALIVSGRLRGDNPASAAAKANKIGFGAGYSGVVAEISLMSFSSSGKKQLANFAVEPSAPRRGAPNPKVAAANNAAIGAALAAMNAPPEKLSPDVEAPARRLGRAAGDKIVAFAREQGWATAPEGGEAAAAPPPDEKPAKLPPVRAQKKQAAPPPDQDEPDKN